MKMSKNLQITGTLLAGLMLSVNIPIVIAGLSLKYNINKLGAVGDGMTQTHCFFRKKLPNV